MEITAVQDLLQQVSKKIKAHEEEKNTLKESFNFFYILGISTKENYHSKFITELLNPKGLHGCGNIFLKAFVQTITILNGISTENLQGGYFKTEEDMGYIPTNYSDGGRADIFIRINGHLLLIENKIYAADRPKQLLRYNKYTEDEKHNYNTCKILYLTLNGKSPSDDSCGHLKEGKDFHCISYKHHIHRWLERCIEICPDHAIVKETIKGYLTVIKFLTNQTSYHKMQNEIKKLLLENTTYLEAAAEMSNIIDIIKNEADEKIRGINRLLKDYYSDRNISQIEIENCFPYEGSQVFYVKINNGEKIEISHDNGVLYCSDRQFPKALIEPYKAQDFVDAFIDDLNNKYSNI